MKYIIFLFRAIWLALSLLILFFSMHRLSLLDSTRDVSELISLMSYGMMVICFPTGIVFFIALIAYSALFDHGLASKSDQRFASIRSTG
ncbi:hypothetical protein P4I15_24645, partial [Escherichia coli]